jgi:hypothetical protein
MDETFVHSLRELPFNSQVLTSGAYDGGSDEILVVDDANRVIWLSSTGERIIRQFSCECKPLDAVFCSFPGDESDTVTVAILLNSGYIRLHQSSGDYMDVRLTAPCIRIWSIPQGLLLQSMPIDYDDNQLHHNRDSFLKSPNSSACYESPMSAVSPSSPSMTSFGIGIQNQQQGPVLYTLSHSTATPIPVHIPSTLDTTSLFKDNIRSPTTMQTPGGLAIQVEMQNDVQKLLNKDTIIAGTMDNLLITYNSPYVNLWNMMEVQDVVDDVRMDTAGLNTVMRGTMNTATTGSSVGSGGSRPSVGGWTSGMGPSISLDAPLPLSRAHSGMSGRSSPANLGAQVSMAINGRESPLISLEGVLGDSGIHGRHAVDREASGGSPLVQNSNIDGIGTIGSGTMSRGFNTNNHASGAFASEYSNKGLCISLRHLDSVRLEDKFLVRDFSFSGCLNPASSSVNGKLMLHILGENSQLARYLIDTNNSNGELEASLILQSPFNLSNDQLVLSIAHICVPLVPGDSQATVGLHIVMHKSKDEVDKRMSLFVGSTRIGPLPLTYGDDLSDGNGNNVIETVQTRRANREMFLVSTIKGEQLMSLPNVLLLGEGAAAGPILAAVSSLHVGNSSSCKNNSSRSCNEEPLEMLIAFFLFIRKKKLRDGELVGAALRAAFTLPISLELPESALAVASAYGVSIGAEVNLRCNLFDALHASWEDLLLQGACDAANVLHSLGSALAACATASGKDGLAYCQYYALHGVHIPQDVISGGHQQFTMFAKPPNAALWLADSLRKINSICEGEDMEIEFDELYLPAFGCPGLMMCQMLLNRLVDNVSSTDLLFQQKQSILAQLLANAYIAEDSQLKHILRLPAILRALIEIALYECRELPADILRQWDDRVLQKIGRHDLSKSLKLQQTYHTQTLHLPQGEISDGLPEVETAALLRFAEDERVHEACRMLRSSGTIYLRVEKAPETSDLDHRHRLQMRLLTLCRRSLACSVGRGMLTMGSLEPLMAEALPVPCLNLSGRVAPNNSIVKLDTDAAPSELTLWPEFHNGVAAGLRVGPARFKNAQWTATAAATAVPLPATGQSQERNVTRNWIVYNRTAANAAANAAVKANAQGAVEAALASHAGVLLGLGLQKHLSVLSNADILDYLQQGHEPTTVAMLIGMAASKQGSAHPRLSKTLCCYIPSLLPSRHQDIDISPLVQTAALAGLGLLHVGTGHRLITEFLLTELGRRPTSDRCECRESMSLTAAWSLGLVLIGRGTSTGMGGLVDLHIEDRLCQLFSGGRKPAESYLFPTYFGSSGDSSTRPSRVLEGDDINTDVTGPGALLALGLIYIRSGNADIAKRMALPHTVFEIDRLRPDMLLYRAISICLVIWDSVIPSADWIEKQVPSSIRCVLFKEILVYKEHGNDLHNPSRNMNATTLDLHTALCAYLCIVTGYGLGMSLVFAGTGNERAKQAILKQLKFVQSLRDNKPGTLPHVGLVDKSTRPTIDMCVSTLSIGLSIVMAGTGDIQCLRIFRELRWKVDDVMYGCHLALGMAIGMLFLAGGTTSVKRDPISIACLLMSALPRFPARTVDNQYHLQPLRHLYVLAVESRVLRTVDVDSGQPVSVNVNIDLTNGEVLKMRAPCLLPELDFVRAVHVTTNQENLMSSTLRDNSNISFSCRPSNTNNDNNADMVTKPRNLFAGSQGASKFLRRANDLYPTSLYLQSSSVRDFDEKIIEDLGVTPLRVKRRPVPTANNLDDSAKNRPTVRVLSTLNGLKDIFETANESKSAIVSTEEMRSNLEPSQGNELTLELLMNMLSNIDDDNNHTETLIRDALETSESLTVLLNGELATNVL